MRHPVSRHLLLAFLVACSPKSSPLDSGPATQECSIEVPAATSLTTSGAHVLDGHGRRVFLRGANTGGRAKFAPYVPFDIEGDFDGSLDAYLDQLQGWGFTTLRVPFSWAAYEPNQDQIDEEWAGRYDALLDGAAARDMWTIVDFHQDIYGEFFCGDGFPRWTVDDPDEDRHDCPDWFLSYLSDDDVSDAFDAFWAPDSPVMSAFETMWDRMAMRHADRPGVIGFEVINEPGAGSVDEAVWAPETLTPFYSRMAGRIQAVDSDALVFFDSTGMSAILSETHVARPDGEGLVFAPHSYDSSIFLGGGDLDPEPVADRIAGWHTAIEDWDMPLLLGEFGGPADRGGIEAYAGAHFDALDTLQSHGTYWEVSDSPERWNAEDFSLIDADGNPRDGLIDAIVRAYPRALAEDGTAGTAWSWDTAGRTLTLAYDGLPDGVSEVVLPSRLYASGVSVSVTGGCAEVHGDRLFIQGEGGPVQVVVGPGGEER
jgi:endoglycosylceramidase